MFCCFMFAFCYILLWICEFYGKVKTYTNKFQDAIAEVVPMISVYLLLDFLLHYKTNVTQFR